MYKGKIIQRDKTKGPVGRGPVHLGKHLCFRGGREKKGGKKKNEREEKGIRSGIVPCLQVCVQGRQGSTVHF